MTTLSLLGGDWLLSFDDENDGGLNVVAGLRKLEYVSGPVRTTNEVYSAVADNVDEFQAMGFRNAMLPVTPNAYTMENFYFIPRSSTEWLKEGAITANWTATGTRTGDGCIRKEYAIGLGANFVAADVGKQVTESASTDTGTLLDFDVDPDGTLVAWIRPDDPSTDLFDSVTGTISVTGDGGTGTVDVSVAGTSGFTQYSAIQAIGSVPSATEVYVIQDRFKLADSATNTFQWWETDADVSLGIISILVRVLDSGATASVTTNGIAQGDVEVFARRYTSLYDNFRLNVAAGGFQALPVNSAPDINNTTGYRTFTGSAGVSDFDVGNGIYVGATWATATKKGVLTAVGGSVASPVLDYYLVGDLTDFAGSDAVKEYVFATGADGDGTCTAAAPTDNTGGPTDSGTAQGGTVTVTLGNVLVDHDGDGTAEPYSAQINAQGPGANGVPIAKVYERIKYITRRGATTTDLFGAGVNVPGETYRGMEVIAEYDANTGTPTEGDDTTISAGDSGAKPNFSARWMSINTTNSPTYACFMDIQTSLQSIQNNDVVEDEGGDDITVNDGTLFGTTGLATAAIIKQSPFGSFTGSQIFGAQGINYTGFADDDTQAYILIDDLGNQRTPPNTVTYTVGNTAAGDRVLVARDTGTAGIIDKDQFGGMATPAVGYNEQGDNIIRVAGTIDSEVPGVAYVRIVENALQEEHHYVYQSRTAQASGEFTLKALTGGNTGAATASSSATQLVDDGRNFVSDGVEVGMMVRNTTALKTTHVWEVTGFATTGLTANDTLLVRPLYGSPDDWDATDTYEINLLIQTYAATDDLFDLILDVEATGTTTSNTFVQSTTFGTVCNVRQGKVILPFTQNQSVNASGATVTVVRQPDTIAV